MANPTTPNPAAPNAAAPKTDAPNAAAAAFTFPTFPAMPAFGSFDPMAIWTAQQQTWQKLMTDSLGRAQTFADQYVAIESQMIARAHEAITTMAQLTHDALAYSAQVSGEARKVGFDAVRKMGVSA